MGIIAAAYLSLLALLFACAHGKPSDHEKDCTLILVSEVRAELQIREDQVICVTEGPSYNVYPINRDDNSEKLITLFKSGHLVSNRAVLQLKGGIVYDGDTLILPNEWAHTLPLLENKEIQDFKVIESEEFTDTPTVGDSLLFTSPRSRLMQDSNSMSTSMSVPTSMPNDNNFSFSQSIPSSPTSSAPSVTHSSTPTLTAVPTSLPSVMPSLLPSSLPSVKPSLLPSSLPSVKPSLLPSSLPSVKPSSLPSVYVCKDVTDKVAFTRKKKGWSCKKLRKQNDKKKDKICEKIFDAQRQCAITCNSCFSNSSSLITSAPAGVY